MIFEPEEIDDLGPELLEVMDEEELAEFKEQLEETLASFSAEEPEDVDSEAWEIWRERMDILEEMLEEIPS